MAKLTYESALEAVEAAKAKRKESRATLDKFIADNGLKPKKNHSDDPKHGKAYAKLHKAWSADKDAQEAAEKAAKEPKPATERNSKYDYPADVVTADDKKKYRAKMRTAAKNEGKPAKEPKVKAEKKAKEEAPVAKSDKKKKKSEEPAAAEPVAKKKKKKVVAED